MVTHLDLAKGIALGTGINGLEAISCLCIPRSSLDAYHSGGGSKGTLVEGLKAGESELTGIGAQRPSSRTSD